MHIYIHNNLPLVVFFPQGATGKLSHFSNPEMPGIIHFDSEEEVQGLLNAFYSRGYRDVDTASTILALKHASVRPVLPVDLRFIPKFTAGEKEAPSLQRLS